MATQRRLGSDLLEARFWITSGLPTIRELAWFAEEAGFYDESVMKTFAVTEWVNLQRTTSTRFYLVEPGCTPRSA